MTSVPGTRVAPAAWHVVPPVKGSVLDFSRAGKRMMRMYITGAYITGAARSEFRTVEALHERNMRRRETVVGHAEPRQLRRGTT